MFFRSVIALLAICMSINIIQHVKSKVITVNNSGSNSTTCCINGTCLCNSLYDALNSIENETIVNITSKSVSLEDEVNILEYFDNVKIKGNNAVVMCKNKGKMYWGPGDNILIEGITWDQCGNPRYPADPAFQFNNIYHIAIVNCIFQHSKVCKIVDLSLAGAKDVSVYVVNSSIIHNEVQNTSNCNQIHGINIQDFAYAPTEKAEIMIFDSMFHSNRYTNANKKEEKSFSIFTCFLYSPFILIVLVQNSTFSSNEIFGAYFYNGAYITSKIVINNVAVFNNSQGGFKISSIGSKHMLLDIKSSYISQNNNGALVLDVGGYDQLINLNEVTFVRNKGAYDFQGAALYIKANPGTVINMFHCNFDHNAALGGDSIVYIASRGLSYANLLVNSSRFVNNQFGSALYVSQLILTLYNNTIFQNNSAKSGAAIYTDKNTQITAFDESLIQFVNNSASLRGGAIYTDLSNCFSNGILFFNLTNFSSLMFINNTAKISGNSIYFSIPKSCSIQRDVTKNDSVAYIPYKLKYIQSHNTIGPAIGTTPYRINLCSPHSCGTEDENCSISDKKMLGQTVYFSATVCDYFNVIAEPVQFQIKCINCDAQFRLYNNEILVNSKSPDEIIMLAIDAHDDVVNDSNIKLELYSVLSDDYKEVSARLSLTISTCYNGFIFSSDSQQCDCYSSDSDDIVQCQEDHAEIKLGYWFGTVLKIRAASLCPINYCDFSYRTETRSNYYFLPKKTDDQCSSHRTGVACSYCKSGYTLAYDSFDCVNINHCSPGMTVLVIALTFLYWTLIVVVLFGFAYYCSSQVSSGYFNGVIYFYSIVDVLLVSNLYIMDGIFYTVAVLSSFAKLTPQFLGRLCIAKGLDAIDQQFIHYSHTLFISFILIGIVITAKYLKRFSFYVNRCIARVTFLFLTVSYTPVTSTSLQLLRGIQYNDIDGVFVYLSPQFKYFTHRHAVYATVALLCGLIIVIGLPILLIVEPFLKKKIIIMKLKPILNQFQDSYKDKYQWFAGYYLLCRLVIILIAYFGNSDYNNMVYYLQTACVIITMNHVFFCPYKKHLVNILDVAILLTMLLAVNLNNFDFTKSATAGLVYILLLIPLLLLFGISFTKIVKMKLQKFTGTHNQDGTQR